MNKYIYYLICFIVVFFASCKDDNEGSGIKGGDKVTVEIITEIETRATVITSFSNGDKMNVYAKTYGKPDAPDFVENITGTFQNNSWILTPEITLSEGEKTFIYSFFPYIEGVGNLNEIPVDISLQQDILYSGNFVPVSYTTPQATLIMKHALSLITFNISNQGYSGNGNLKNITVTGENIFIEGTMGIESGKITGIKTGNLTSDFERTVVSNGWTENLPHLWTVPFNSIRASPIFHATIDGNIFKAKFPEVEIKSGFQYIFRLVLTDNGLEFIPDQTIVISLNQDSDEMEELTAHGILEITHTSNMFVLPLLTGDNIFGFVNWGDNHSDSYSINGSHSYTGNTEKRVIIESWNSTGFELSNLIEIQAIDISQY